MRLFDLIKVWQPDLTAETTKPDRFKLPQRNLIRPLQDTGEIT